VIPGCPVSIRPLGGVLHNPVAIVAISSPRTVEQLRQNLKALSVPLSTEMLAKLDEIWPGPGGEVSQAYA
jgi:aryl-alcohol dehydrogenase-like predicted oxidoreductase